jgi:hypothetical protein
MNDPVTRRKALAAIGGTALAVGVSHGAETATTKSDLIAKENARPGTRDWLLTKTKIDEASKYRCPWIEGYCSHASIKAGEEISFFVSTRPTSKFRLQIYRMGYYGGTGGRLMQELGPFEGRDQPDPPVGDKRLRDCQWEANAKWQIPADWVSGVYLGKLTEESQGLQSYVIFIVRDERKADFVFQCSDHTWQAYNRWPSQFSLYDNGTTEWYWGGNVQISLNRPYGKYCQILDQPLSTGSGEFFLWEFPFVHWMEEQGYDVTYISNQDTHRDAAGLLRCRGFLSVGHDEYWTLEMFHNMKAAIAAGVSVGFFSGNAVFGKIGYESARMRTFERTGIFSAPGGTAEFEFMKTLPHERPYGNELRGAHTTGPVIGGADWICSRPDHWVFEGTGMKQGEGIQGVVGWEFHGEPATIEGLEIVSTGPTQGPNGPLNGGVYTATIYPGPNKNFVFNAATCWWADGLSEPPGYVRPAIYRKPQGPDKRQQRITRNILDRMLHPTT